MCFGNNREQKLRTLGHNSRISTVSFIQLREKGAFASLAYCCKPETMEPSRMRRVCSSRVGNLRLTSMCYLTVARPQPYVDIL